VQIRKNTNGGQAVYLSWKDGSKVHLQLPFMRTPFGFSAFTDKKTQKVNYSLDLSFDNDDQEAQVLLAKINALDDIMVKTVAANSTEWLGKPLKEEGLREMLLSPTPHASKKGGYAPTLKLKVGVDPKTDKIIPEAFNLQQQQVDITTIEKQSKVMTIVELNQVWFVDKKFGISVKLLQVLLQPSKTLPKFAFKLPDTTADEACAPMAVDGGSGDEGEEEDQNTEEEYEEEDEVDQ
jgi:hypothetical protein